MTLGEKVHSTSGSFVALVTFSTADLNVVGSLDVDLIAIISSLTSLPIYS